MVMKSVHRQFQIFQTASCVSQKAKDAPYLFIKGVCEHRNSRKKWLKQTLLALLVTLKATVHVDIVHVCGAKATATTLRSKKS